METDIMASYHNGETFADENYSNFSIVNKKKRAKQRAAAEAAAVASEDDANSRNAILSVIDIQSEILKKQLNTPKKSFLQLAFERRFESKNPTKVAKELIDSGALTDSQKNSIEKTISKTSNDDDIAVTIKNIDLTDEQKYKIEAYYGNTDYPKPINIPVSSKQSIESEGTPNESISSKNEAKVATTTATPIKSNWLSPNVIIGAVLLIGGIAYLKMRKKTV